MPPARGAVVLLGKQLAGKRPNNICLSGLSYVEERLVFPNLTVEENLQMGMQRGVPKAPRWTIEDMFNYFPRLRERRNQRLHVGRLP